MRDVINVRFKNDEVLDQVISLLMKVGINTKQDDNKLKIFLPNRSSSNVIRFLRDEYGEECEII